MIVTRLITFVFHHKKFTSAKRKLFYWPKPIIFAGNDSFSNKFKRIVNTIKVQRFSDTQAFIGAISFYSFISFRLQARYFYMQEVKC